MARVLQHFRRPTEPPVGVWWETAPGKVTSSYVDDGGAEHIYGRQVMAGKSPSASWDQMFDSLENHNPFVAGWESADVAEDPTKFLKRMQKIGKKAA